MKANNRYHVFLFFVLLVVIGCKNTGTGENKQHTPNSKNTVDDANKGQAFIEGDESVPNVLQIAIKSPDHTILVKAVQAAGLENVLVNAGPLMAFAPTDDAFNQLPNGTLADLLKPENKDILANILKHHVTPGNYSQDFLRKFKKLGQANNQNVIVEVKGDNIYVGGAKIIGSVKAGNGIVHVVDKVIIPPSE